MAKSTSYEVPLYSDTVNKEIHYRKHKLFWNAALYKFTDVSDG
jgi:hypothetical protein